MAFVAPVSRLVNLLDPAGNILFNVTSEEAQARVGSGDPQQVRGIEGQFALIHQDGIRIRMARSIGRPMRYFLAKRVDGPCLVVAERIDEIAAWLTANQLGDQFHPSYTRMVPAHYIVELNLVGCPDPNPRNTRYFTPPRNQWTADLDDIGARYIGALAQAINHWLDGIDPREPLGVLFSGGIDSGAVLLTLYHQLLARGESPARLKAFTLSVAGSGADLDQARQFCAKTSLDMLLEPIEVPAEAVDYRRAIRLIEDYKPLDVQSAAMALALCEGIRARYSDWLHLIDGDGGDENLKDYPIEENSELTIRSVLNNLMLYHEGWGVEAVKHSLTYSGGQSRGHVRSFAPARCLGFRGFSPFALPSVIEVAEGIPFIDLTGWDHSRLYSLKGEIVARGVRAVTGRELPVFEKRRFQHGAVDAELFREQFPARESRYRAAFEEMFEVASELTASPRV
jgi:asparagine synthase (glutamine-hydrolysing)